jgi:UDP-N-acetylglucosamine 2-epimerase
MSKKLVVFGTRPEFIKLLPVIDEIKKQKLEEAFVFVFTGQHGEMTKELFHHFNFKPFVSIPLRNLNNSLSRSFAYILTGLQKIIDDIQKSYDISMIIGQGDTTSCACAAMSAFYNEIPFAHIEAGLRTNNFNKPFPEEYFRRIISLTTTIHFAPTESARENLLREGIAAEKIVITGNTIVDVIEMIKPMISGKNIRLLDDRLKSANNILITCHRRENQNGNFHILAGAIKTLSAKYSSYNFIWISHKTPFIMKELKAGNFNDHPNIFILPPVGLPDMYYLYSITKLIITDSGGIQEESPGFHIPVIVTREFTERNESVKLGYSIISGMNREKIIDSFNYLIQQPGMIMKNPYGDGKSGKRIVDYLKH